MLLSLYFVSWPMLGFTGFSFDVSLALGVLAMLIGAGVATGNLTRRLVVELARLLALGTALGLLNELAFEHRRLTGNWPKTGFSLTIEVGAPVLALLAARALDRGGWTTSRRLHVPEILRIDRLGS
jgi:hypothetical protein